MVFFITLIQEIRRRGLCAGGLAEQGGAGQDQGDESRRMELGVHFADWFGAKIER